MFRSVKLPAVITLIYLVYSFVAIGLVKIVVFYVLKTFRFYLNGNLRNVIIVGNGEGVEELKDIFLKKKELGYILRGVFSNSKDKNNSGTISESFSFLKNNQNIDEIYCAIDDLSENEVNEYVKFANLNHCNIKFVPNALKIYTKRLSIDYYNYIPVLSIQEGVAK